MKERPILFSAPMVRAILKGTKTMTRRVIKHEPHADCPYLSKDGVAVKSPYGKVGDRLWVRETWLSADDGYYYMYRADMPMHWNALDTPHGEDVDLVASDFKWKPSIFMPREASRITLEITNVRIERLNDISEEDAAAEGSELSCGEMKQDFPNYKRTFHRLWDSINAKYHGWDANPFVWVIEFKKL